MDLINISLTIILVITTIIYTYITYRTLKSYNNPILYIEPVLIDTEYEWDKWLMRDLDPVRQSIRGLSWFSIDKKVRFKIVNNGITPAHNIDIRYEIVAYQNSFEFGIDEADIKKYFPIPYKNSKRIKHINYLAPKQVFEFDIVFTSNFPKIEVYVDKLKSNEMKAIRKKTLILEYNNKDFIELGDSDDFRKMIGLI